MKDDKNKISDIKAITFLGESSDLKKCLYLPLSKNIRTVVCMAKKTKTLKKLNGTEPKGLNSISLSVINASTNSKTPIKKGARKTVMIVKESKFFLTIKVFFLC